jgi:pimeloyl-ACP methyl ester carboxylesterase
VPYARRDDLSLYYEQEGSGDPPLLFVHGWCCDNTFFKPQFEHFQSSHAVTTLDLRGCGSSDRPDDGYDLPSLADDLAWLCEEMGISRPVIVGHSLGAMIAIELAGRHPSVPSAVVADEPGPINPLPETRRIYEGFAMELEGPDGEAVRRAWIEAGGSNAPARLLPFKVDLHFGMTVGAGHFHQLEAPEQVTAMIERFLLVALTNSRA